jgi:hypothetical protein
LKPAEEDKQGEMNYFPLSTKDLEIVIYFWRGILLKQKSCEFSSVLTWYYLPPALNGYNLLKGNRL